MDFDAYLADLPLLHTWDLGTTWNTGGFDAVKLRRLHDITREHCRNRPIRVLETGAGNSTITFLHLPLAQLVTIAPAPELRERILSYCAEHDIDLSPLDFRLERSEIELPALALDAGHGGAPKPKPRFDVVLLDGGHGWPTVFVDFCYANLMMRAGGLLLLDDVHLHSVAELSRLLEMQPGFTFREQFKKLQVWEKDNSQPFLPAHAGEPYIAEMSRKAAHPSLLRRARRKFLRRSH